ncbi:MAG: RagB/SusD family nutrient uptake outer membrane protein, partial [Rhodothermaceae bacterium]|nr:RagB/SusD family nutrient uptake outer membrane protein [Rhodothermaceae bacterium]
MKRNSYIFTAILGCLLLFQGCDNTLNLDPRGELGSEAVWADAALTEAYLNQVYSATGYGFGNPMSGGGGAVDEAIYTHSNFMDANLQSTLTADNRGIWNRTDNPNNSYEQLSWPRVYATLRDLNVFIQNVEAGDVLAADAKETFLGEAYFLRAFFYHNLLRLYGGVPIVDSP